MADTKELNLGLTANPYLGASNPYLQSIIDSTTKDMTDAYGRTAIPAFNAAMLKSGSFGNSGLDELAGAGAKTLQDNIGDAASKLRFNDYTQQQQMYQWQRNLDQNNDQFGRTLDQNQSQFTDQFGRSVFNDAFSQNQQNLQTGIGLLGTMAGYTANDQQTAAGVQNTPLNYFSQFTNLANALGGNGSSSTATQGTTSSPLTSAIGGAQLGSSWWGGKGNGSSSGSSGGWNWGSSSSNVNGYNPSTGTYQV